MSSNKILTNYVSEIDQFLLKFDHEHPELSKSQQQEIAKYLRVYRLRDFPDSSDPTNKLWDKF